MKQKRLTMKVLDGIIAATSQVLAGPEEGECEADWKAIDAADTWARATRDARLAKAQR